MPREERSTPRVRVEQKRQHHLRLKRRATPPVLTIGGIKRREIQLPHGLQNEPRQVALGQPIAPVRRHQKRLLTITPNEVLRHAQQSLNSALLVHSSRRERGSGRRARSTCCWQVWQRPVQHLKIGCSSSTTFGSVRPAAGEKGSAARG